MSAARNIPTDQEFSATVDAMMNAAFKPEEPGASIIVTRKGKTIYRKGFGMANVELGVKIEPHMVFRMGSVTKQFTAVSILMLMEQGKLDLQDEITKYLPEYPMHGHHITIEHLLTHTSGIKSYTNTPDFMKEMRTDYELDKLVESFKPYAMEFAPGEQYNYNNSAFVMLGLIIEKVSGMKYPEFLQKNIFDPLGMKNSYFDMPNPIIPGRVAGYKPAGEGKFENCDYLSMTLPHAAGSLASCVDDMAKWDAALYTEKLVKQSSLQKAWTPYTLKDGVSTGYGYGWAVAHYQDHHMIMHGGGINGFICDGIRFPDEQVYVMIFTNYQRMIPNEMAFRVGAIASGKPYEEPVAVPFDPALYDNYQGVYRLRKIGMEIPIERKGDKLFIMTPGGTQEELVPLSKTEFASKTSTARLSFTLDEKGKALNFTQKGFYGPGMTADLTDQPLPSQKQAVEVTGATLEQYAGEYELAPGVKMTIAYADGKLTAHIPGQPIFELNAESETKFFLKELPVSFEFQKEGGKVSGLTLNQAGQVMQAKKVK